MKKLLLSVLAIAGVWSCAEVCAADKAQKMQKEQLKQAEKQTQHWYTNLAAAMQQAKRTNLQILVLATGSDWCPPCMKLEKEIFSHKEFYKSAAGKVILVKADFPRRRQQTPEERKQAGEIAERFGVSAFPTVLLLDSSGKVLDKQVGYRNSSPKSYLKKFKGFKK